MNIIKATLYAVLALALTSIGFYVLALPLYLLITSLNGVAADVGNPNLDVWRNLATPIFKAGYWWVGAMAIVGILLWLFMWAGRKEYYTAGGYYVE